MRILTAILLVGVSALSNVLYGDYIQLALIERGNLEKIPNIPAILVQGSERQEDSARIEDHLTPHQVDNLLKAFQQIDAQQSAHGLSRLFKAWSHFVGHSRVTES